MLPKELNTIHSTKKPSKLDENKNSIYLSNMRNFGIWTPFRNKTAMFVCLINNLLRWTLCKNCIKSGRKKPKNLEIGTFQPFVVKFILDTIKDRGNMSTYYGKLSTKSIRQQIKPKKNPQQIGWAIKFYLPLKYEKCRNLDPISNKNILWPNKFA